MSNVHALENRLTIMQDMIRMITTSYDFLEWVGDQSWQHHGESRDYTDLEMIDRFISYQKEQHVQDHGHKETM